MDQLYVVTVERRLARTGTVVVELAGMRERPAAAVDLAMSVLPKMPDGACPYDLVTARVWRASPHTRPAEVEGFRRQWRAAQPAYLTHDLGGEG